MRRAAEIAAFLGLSAAVHAGVVAGLGDSSGGAQGQGAGGADRVTLQAAPDSLAALAERWTTAPETAPAPAILPIPNLPQTTLAPTPDSAPQRLLERNMAGTESLALVVDPRIKAVVAFAPWGRYAAFWVAEGMAGIQ